MEPKPADRRGKKRGRKAVVRDDLDIKESPPVVARGEGEAPPESSRGEEDRISNLPDAVLGEIVSLLPTKDGARTQILSTRWRPIWRCAPLNLDLFDDSTDCVPLTGVVSHILSSHEGPGKLFKLPWYYVHHYPDTVDDWLEYPALDNLQEIDFCNTGRGPALDPHPPLPASLVRFSSTLHVVTLRFCRITDDIVEMLRFPQLKKLTLEFVGISEGSLHSLIAGCPALECLLLDHSYGFSCIRINAINLVSIGVDSTYPLSDIDEIIIENAPILQRFIYHQWNKGLQVSIISAPKLESLGCHFHNDDSSSLMFGTTVIQGMHVSGFTTVLSTIKVLAVNMHTLCLDTIIGLMKCFPCLEKLYVQPHNSGGKNVWHHKHRPLIQTLDIRIKKLVMFGYQGTKSHVNFATFFILNAKLLEMMRFKGGPYNGDEMFVADQHQKLQLEKRASMDADFCFITDECLHDISHIRDINALSHADPFECRHCH